MNRIFKSLLILGVICCFAPTETLAKKKVESIASEKEYGFKLDSPAASMTLKYTIIAMVSTKVEDEFIFEEGNAYPTIRIVKEFRKGEMSADTLLYNKDGKIVRVGKYRNFDIEKRVEYFDESHTYFLKWYPPTGGNPNSNISLTDYDSHGNWQTAYSERDKKNALLKRAISYQLSPEQEALIAQYKPMLKTAEEKNRISENIHTFIDNGLPVIAIICALLCILSLGIKDAAGGKLRWIIIIVLGIPSASVLFFCGVEYVTDNYPKYKFLYELASLGIYIACIQSSIKAIMNDRRISNFFISFFSTIWSIWALFILCPHFMASFMPNLFGRVLSWLLAAGLYAANIMIFRERCPRCHNPHGLELYDETLEGTKTEISRSSHRSEGEPRITDFSDNGHRVKARVEQDFTDTCTTTATTYQMIRQHFKCKECGHMESSGLMKGWILSKNSSSTTKKTRKTTDWEGTRL